jgi:hypothetical protein
MHTTKLAWFALPALVMTASCAQPRDPEPAPLGNGTSAASPAELDSTALGDTPPAGPTDPPAPAAEARTRAAPRHVDAGAPDASPPPKKDVAACVAACEAKYPGGAAKSQMIDQCWADHCGACQNMPTSGVTLKTPTSGASCQTGVYTPSADCSQCTTDWCCWAWDMCFNDAECTALNTCSVACTK